MLVNYFCKRFADHHANIQGQARIFPSHPARTFHQQNVIGILLDERTGAYIGDNLLQVGEIDRLIYHDQLFYLF